jgi:hypothetical protein
MITFFHGLSFRRMSLAGFLVVFLVLFCVYAATLAPSVTAGDSGELATAMHLHGVAHPPGYPTWCIVVGAFSDFVSLFFGNGTSGLASPVFRSNLSSAIFGALAAAVLFLILFSATGCFISSLSTSLMVGLGRSHWSLSVITEVYMLNTLFFALVLLFVQRYRRSGRLADLLVATSVFGFSLGNHWPFSILACAPVLGLLAFHAHTIHRRRGWLATMALGTLALALFAALPYLVMYLRALSGPAINWGNPSDFERFLFHVSRGQYQFVYQAIRSGLMDKVLFLGRILSLFIDQYTVVPLLMVPLGAAFLRRSDRPLLLALLFIVLLNPIALVLQQNVLFSPDLASASVDYYTCTYMSVAILVGAGLCFLVRSFPRGRLAFLGLALAFVGLQAFRNFEANDRSHDRMARDYGIALLDSLDPGALVFASEDQVAFPLLYLTLVEGRRPDVIVGSLFGSVVSERALAIFVAQGKLSAVADTPLRDAGLGGDPEILASMHRRKGLVARTRREASLRALARDAIVASLIEHGNRPVFVASEADIPFADAPDPSDADRPYFSSAPHGLALRVYRSSSKPDPRSSVAANAAAFQGRLSSEFTNADPRKLDDRSSLLVSSFHLRRAVFLLASHDRDEAIRAFLAAASLGSQGTDSIGNIAGVAARAGLLDLSERILLQALGHDPRNLTARQNLIELTEELSRNTAERERERYLEARRYHSERLRLLTPLPRDKANPGASREP